MKVTRRSDAPDGPMAPDHFDGSVSRRDYGAIDAPDGSALEVSFPAGARTHWHSHPGGQVLFVTDGTARVGTRDGRTEQLEAGDLAYAAPDEHHWHGAAEDSPARHLALSFGATEWYEPVEE
jgi:quercetin dioxygenase-like cupin family protein